MQYNKVARKLIFKLQEKDHSYNYIFFGLRYTLFLFIQEDLNDEAIQKLHLYYTPGLHDYLSKRIPIAKLCRISA